jgi:hypothetical protein
MTLMGRPEAKGITVKKSKQFTKFKARTSRCLYTLVLKDLEKAAKLEAAVKGKFQNILLNDYLVPCTTLSSFCCLEDYGFI